MCYRALRKESVMLTHSSLEKARAHMRSYGEGQHFFDGRNDRPSPERPRERKLASTAPGWYRDWDDEACAFVQKEKQGPVRPEESPA